MQGLDIPTALPLVLPQRMDAIREHRQEGGSIAAVFPICYPRELLRAFNLLPVEVWGPPGVKTSDGAMHLQPYVCSVVHNALSFLLAGGLGAVDLLLVPHACDSLQGLGSLLIDFVSPRQPVLPLYLPRGRRASDIDFLADELRSIYRRLQEISGRSPSQAEMMECIFVEESADELLVRLHRERRKLPFDDLAFYRLVRSREYLPAERFSRLAQDALSQAADKEHLGEKQVQQGIPILLSGILPEPMDLFQALSDMGGCVVADDLACCGRRLYPQGTSEDPFQRMAERIVFAPPDPMRGSPIDERLEHLFNLAEVSGARGVLFYEVKFCEPELFDLPELRQGLRQAGLPSQVVEIDLNDPLSQTILTRMEAFLEMLR